jgi:hypothetical protein
MTDATAIHERRAKLRRAYGELYAQLSRALFEADLAGINFGDNTDEYEPEVDTILPRLGTCDGPLDVLTVLHEEFSRWFGADEAGPSDRFAELAQVVWKLAFTWRRLAGLPSDGGP